MDIDFNLNKFSLDSSVIIAFFNSDLKYILSGIFKNKIFFSSEIIKEIHQYGLNIFNYEILEITTYNEFEYFINISRNNPGLSIADAHFIAISKFNDLVCVSFEKKIRKICEYENIKNIGLLKLLNEALVVKLVRKNEIVSIIRILKKDGLFIEEEIIKIIIDELTR